MISYALFRSEGRLNSYSLLILIMIAAVVMAVGCGGNVTFMQNQGMGTLGVSISDPPSCMAATTGAAAVASGGTAAPGGTFTNVFVTIRSIQAHISATADPSSSGWQELAPQLVSAPVQVDLLHLPANGQCLLEQ